MSSRDAYTQKWVGTLMNLIDECREQGRAEVADRVAALEDALGEIETDTQETRTRDRARAALGSVGHRAPQGGPERGEHGHPRALGLPPQTGPVPDHPAAQGETTGEEPEPCSNCGMFCDHVEPPTTDKPKRKRRGSPKLTALAKERSEIPIRGRRPTTDKESGDET